MNVRHDPIGIPRALAIAGLVLPMTGCAEELGPAPLRVARVRGVVREGGRPLSGGWVEFYPVKGTVGNLRSAPLRADGSFEADGVAVGENLIRLVNVSIALSGASKRFGAYSSPIRRIISDRSATPLDVDVVEEMIRFQKSQERHPRVEPSGAGSPP